MSSTCCVTIDSILARNGRLEVEASKQHVNGILAIHIDSIRILARNGRLGSSKLQGSI